MTRHAVPPTYERRETRSMRAAQAPVPAAPSQPQLQPVTTGRVKRKAVTLSQQPAKKRKAETKKSDAKAAKHSATQVTPRSRKRSRPNDDGSAEDFVNDQVDQTATQKSQVAFDEDTRAHITKRRRISPLASGTRQGKAKAVTTAAHIPDALRSTLQRDITTNKAANDKNLGTQARTMARLEKAPILPLSDSAKLSSPPSPALARSPLSPTTSNGNDNHAFIYKRRAYNLNDRVMRFELPPQSGNDMSAKAAPPINIQALDSVSLSRPPSPPRKQPPAVENPGMEIEDIEILIESRDYLAAAETCFLLLPINNKHLNELLGPKPKGYPVLNACQTAEVYQYLIKCVQGGSWAPTGRVRQEILLYLYPLMKAAFVQQCSESDDIDFAEYFQACKFLTARMKVVEDWFDVEEV